MKSTVTKLLLVCALLGLAANQIANADVNAQQAEEIFNLAEQALPQFFSPPLTTQTLPPDWPYYRGPYNNNIYVGINVDCSVYVLGGSFGNVPVNVGTYQEALTLVQNNLNSAGSTDTICSTNNLPNGINYSQDGNVVNVTTDGCIAIPDNQNICESAVSTTPQVTGISVLSDTNVFSSEFAGISSTNPALIDSLNVSGANTFCTINAPEGFAPSTVNINVCYDVTSSFSQVSSLPGVTITPPVTSTINSTQNNNVVSDCFNTGAQTITDNVTGEVWVLQNGSYQMIPNI
ncbi:MAG: hypothetical protein V3U75_07770 [Methylococcaceae bacterium]